MTKDTKIILIAGIVLLVVTYLLLYSPLSNAIFGIKEVKVVNIPNPSLTALKPKVNSDIAATVSFEVLNKHAISSESKTISIVLPPVSLRNPFGVDFAFEKSATISSPEVEVKKPSMFVLQGIFKTDQEHPMALIDDKMLVEGQKIYGYTVTKIYSEQVVLEKGRQVKVLKLKMGVD